MNFLPSILGFFPMFLGCHPYEYLSNEKNLGWLGYTTPLYRDYFINHEIRIPSLTIQDDSWKVGPGPFLRGSSVDGSA